MADRSDQPADTTGRKRTIPRRTFVKTAVSIGGGAALAACLDREEPPELPQGPTDLSELPERQHAWNESLVTDGGPRKLRAWRELRGWEFHLPPDTGTAMDTADTTERMASSVPLGCGGSEHLVYLRDGGREL